MVSVRPVSLDHHEDWLRLWRGYQALLWLLTPALREVQ